MRHLCFGGKRSIQLRVALCKRQRSLRDIGISPAAAAYESGKPFWQKMGCLR